MTYEELIQRITDIFYSQLDARATFAESQDMLDGWETDLSLLDVYSFGEKMVLELGLHVDRNYLRNKFESERN